MRRIFELDILGLNDDWRRGEYAGDHRWDNGYDVRRRCSSLTGDVLGDK